MLQSPKTLLKGMSLDELKTWCQSKGESSFRGMQLFEWMYKIHLGIILCKDDIELDP